jgi:hypothetical protein
MRQIEREQYDIVSLFATPRSVDQSYSLDLLRSGSEMAGTVCEMNG